MASELAERMKLASVKHEELRRIIATTSRARKIQDEQSDLIADLEMQIATSSLIVQTLEDRREAEFKDGLPYRDSVVKRLVYKSSGQSEKFRAKEIKEGNEHMLVLKQLQEAQAVRCDLKRQLVAAERGKDEANALGERHRAARQEMDTLVGDIFSGSEPNSEYAQEAKLREDVDNALQAYNDALVRHKEDELRVGLLEMGEDKCSLAVRRLDEACDYSRGEIFGQDTAEAAMASSYLRLAIENIQEARSYATQADGEDPETPIDSESPEEDQQKRTGLMDDATYDSVFVDAKSHKEIKAAHAEARQFREVYRRRMQAAKERVAASVEVYRARKKDMDAAKDELKAERERIFELVVKGEEAISREGDE
ncbi:hypothetical protein N3K66_006951 [Trichothecium roseum]|uniref:Uncharacterized protein n=1 Tax=Trichothecium roseum TaxID=47278 RepID=A0ACC0UY43_9HYPO|nr:hypothetical protein N3K66_006951 [Trichothecium roseum]